MRGQVQDRWRVRPQAGCQPGRYEWVLYIAKRVVQQCQRENSTIVQAESEVYLLTDAAAPRLADSARQHDHDIAR